MLWTWNFNSFPILVLIISIWSAIAFFVLFYAFLLVETAFIALFESALGIIVFVIVITSSNLSKKSFTSIRYRSTPILNGPKKAATVKIKVDTLS